MGGLWKILSMIKTDCLDKLIKWVYGSILSGYLKTNSKKYASMIIM